MSEKEKSSKPAQDNENREHKSYADREYHGRPSGEKPYHGNNGKSSGRPYGKPGQSRNNERKPFRTSSGGFRKGTISSSSNYRSGSTGGNSGKPARSQSYGKGRPVTAPAADDHHDYRQNQPPREDSRPVQQERRIIRPAPEIVKDNLHADGMKSRQIALEVIRDVTENGAYASLSLNEKLKASGLSHLDRRLTTRLVYDTLDHMIYLDYVLSKFMARPDTDIRLRNILRLGACQILLEDRIPDSAATNTSAELCRFIGLDELVGVCNGILRNLIRGRDTIQLPDENADTTKFLSVKYSVPQWLVEKFVAELGREKAEDVLSSGNNQKYTTLRPNLMQLTSEEFEQLLEKKVWDHEKGALPMSWRVKSMADIGLDNDFIAGKFSIQGEGSMMASLAVSPRRGMQILDCCAAPGGKTCLIAEIMQGTGRIQAWDVYPHRVELIGAAAKRLQLENIRPMARDATVLREDLTESMDAVLLDAPCTGLGELNDKPDIRYRLTPESVDEIIELQKKLLDTVSCYVKRGGTLVYSTCSLLPSENELQIRNFLEKHDDFRLAKLPDTIPEKFRQYEDVGLQLLPHRDGMAGFYICKMVRK